MAERVRRGGLRLAALVLAAGAGRRFGGSKLTAALNGRPLLTYALDAALAAPVEEVLLITGFHAEAVESAARRHAGTAFATGRLRTVHARDAVDGLGASLHTGLTATGAADGVFIFLGDMPEVPHDLAARLALELRPEVDAVAPSFDGRRGHPVLISAAFRRRLRHMRGDRGAGAVLGDPDVSLVTVAVDEAGVLRDIDTPAELSQKL